MKLRLGTRYDAGNGEAAAVILSNPQKYAGLQTVWAVLWMSRHRTVLAHPKEPLVLAHRAVLPRPGEQMDLFDRQAANHQRERAA